MPRSPAQAHTSSPASDNSRQDFSSREMLQGKCLEGREILICWDDGVWYDAVVVSYYECTDEYKMVYRADDAIEIAKLRDRRWILAPKKRTENNRPVLDGAVIDFEYPSDGKRYRAMVYDYSHRGERLKIAYVVEHETDNLKGGGWDFVTESPCLDDSPMEEPEPRSSPRSRSAEVDDDDDVKDEPLPLPVNVALAAKAAAAAAAEKASSGISKRKRSPRTSTRRSSNASASRSSTRVSTRTRRSSTR